MLADMSADNSNEDEEKAKERENAIFMYAL